MGWVILVRHGETAWNRERRIQGWAPTGLTDTGHRQVESLCAGLLASYDVGRVIASDLKRARETAEPIGRAIGVDVEFDERWRERNFGVCQGFEYETFSEEFPHLSVTRSGRDAVDTAPEAGETLQEMADRVVAAWNDVAATTGADETTVVVTHGGPIALVLGHLRGLHVADGLLEHRLDNCAITEIDVSDTSIVRENDRLT